ncbi:hypothetical protein OUZ56_027208 [Daphnia magna]|uniref:Secreted protein n=1 Tax=Daphnia magna TaxID=35525 RepID=A0ABQ9ZPT5_9CRUS|nr:hypothetical protein OUZ56_027208 [Daphnia magna]
MICKWTARTGQTMRICCLCCWIFLLVSSTIIVANAKPTSTQLNHHHRTTNNKVIKAGNILSSCHSSQNAGSRLIGKPEATYSPNGYQSNPLGFRSLLAPEYKIVQQYIAVGCL